MQDADSPEKGKNSSDKTSDTSVEKDKSSPAQLRKTRTSQGPTTIADTVRSRPAAPTGPKMDWKFSIIASVACMFLALATHIFGINGGLVLNDKYNLSFLFNQAVLGKTSERLVHDMLGVAPLSEPWLKASFISDLGEYKFSFPWYHSVNVFWHAIATGVLFFFVLTIGRHLYHQKRTRFNPYFLATASAALFACHPLTCETVTYLSCRSALLGAVNFFQSLLFLLLGVLVKHPLLQAGFLVMAVYTGAMSIWSSPESLGLPVVALFSLFLVKHPLAEWKQTLQEHPFVAGTAAALSISIPCLALLPVQTTAAVNLFLPTLSSLAYGASQVKAFAFYYLRCFLVPLGLSIDPPMALAGNLSDPFVWVGAAVIAALIYLVVKLKEPVVGLGGILVLAGFLPHALMLQPDAVADWVAYLPLAGMALLSACGLCRLGEISLPNTTIFLACVVLAFCGLSIYRDWEWGSNYSILQSALRLRPKSGFLHANMALEYLRRSQLDEAEKEAALSVAHSPGLVIAELARAKVKVAREKFEEAGKLLEGCLSLAEAQKLSPVVKSEIRLSQLQCLIGLRKEKEANGLLMKLFTELPGDDSRLILQIGMAEFQAMRFERAFKVLDKAVGTNPSLSECWAPMTESAMALRAFETAYQTARSYVDNIGGPNASLLFARAALVSSHEDEAEETLKQMLAENPKDARVLYLLSRLYERTSKKDAWKKYRDMAIKIEPDIAEKYPLPELDVIDTRASGQVPAEPSPGEPPSGAPTGTPEPENSDGR